MMNHVLVEVSRPRRWVGCAALVLIFLGAGAVRAAPFGVRMTLHADPQTAMGISWNSDDPTDNVVVYGRAADTLTERYTVGSEGQHPMPDPLGTSFSAELNGLTAGTAYYFKVGHDGALYPSGAPFTFTTRSADACAMLRFVVIGDNRADYNFGSPGVSPLYAPIMDEILAFAPDMLLNTGDMVKNGDNAAEWNNMIRASEPSWSRIPSILTVGNHDDGDPDGDGALYNRLFALPHNEATASEDYYAIDVGLVHFVSLTSQHADTNELQQMAAWLDADLAATAQPWKIVFFHKAIYSRGNHYTGDRE